ncbi:MAG: hypothetical protein IIX42_04755, partial [Alistipes sp.]|nr:hypothetical protein [Alistipes sp.]
LPAMGNTEVCPIAVNPTERCICTILTIKWVQTMSGVQSFFPSVNPPLESFHCSASAISVAVQALQKPKMKICEQAPIFNIRLLHLRCTTAIALGLIAALYLHYFDDKMVQEIRINCQFVVFLLYELKKVP